VSLGHPRAAIRWSQTSAPQGVVVPGAQWLQTEGAGGTSTNVQVAARHGPRSHYAADAARPNRWCPRQDLNLCSWLRRPVLYPG
jgi:hypothetical protein